MSIPSHNPGVIDQVLHALQARADTIVRLPRQSSQLTDRTADYSDLLGASTAVEAVVECDRAPLVYLASSGDSEAAASLLVASAQERVLAGRLANRSSSAALLSVDTSLHARLWRCRFGQEAAVSEFNLSDPVQTENLLLRLQDGLTLQPREKAQEFELRDLLKDSVRRVADGLQAGGIGKGAYADDVLALVGRAVFSRFLLDRKILSPRTAPELFDRLSGGVEFAFENPINAGLLCEWLDRTFNGELLPFATEGRSYEAYFASLRQSSASDALRPLTWIMSKTHAGGQLPLWDWLDFAHIPAGVLSEVYEDFAHFRFPQQAKSESIHYTPRHIARTVVTQALLGIQESRRHLARTIDPAVGAGVFLCLMYRELAKWEYRNTGTWPETRRLRSLLYGQLCGFDINQDALKLAALSLYLSAIELDAAPIPPAKLHFAQPLIGTVLYNVKVHPNASDADAVLGSVRRNHPRSTERFDVVVGNPPWTSLRGREAKALDRRASELAKSVAAQRRVEIEYSNPDHVPDLPFVWKSAELLEPDGVVALVLHGRLLSKSSEVARSARAAMFKCFAVQGMLNGSELVEKMAWWWPTVNVPFCILFARNAEPSLNHTFTILSPRLDGVAERRPHLRLDPALVATFDLEGLRREPDLPLILGKASPMDAALVRKIKRRVQARPTQATGSGRPLEGGTLRQRRDVRYVSLGDYLSQPSLRRGRGYKEGDKSKELTWALEWDKVSEVRPTEVEQQVYVRGDDLQRFERRPMERSREVDLYRLPLLLIRESPGEFDSRGGAVLVDNIDGETTHAVFSASFLGVSLAAHPNGRLLGKYLALLLSSVYSYHFYLLTTGFAERRRVVDIDLETLPILPLEDSLGQGLTSISEIDALFDELARRTGQAPNRIDEWAARVLMFNESDLRVMRDTVRVSSPFKSSRDVALARVSEWQMQQFSAELSTRLAAYLVVPEESVAVVPLHSGRVPGWEFIGVAKAGPLHERITSPELETLSALALAAYPASQVMERVTELVVVGRPCNYGQWLPSRAALLAPQLSQLLGE